MKFLSVDRFCGNPIPWYASRHFSCRNEQEEGVGRRWPSGGEREGGELSLCCQTFWGLRAENWKSYIRLDHILRSHSKMYMKRKRKIFLDGGYPGILPSIRDHLLLWMLKQFNACSFSGIFQLRTVRGDGIQEYLRDCRGSSVHTSLILSFSREGCCPWIFHLHCESFQSPRLLWWLPLIVNLIQPRITWQVSLTEKVYWVGLRACLWWIVFSLQMLRLVPLWTVPFPRSGGWRVSWAVQEWRNQAESNYATVNMCAPTSLCSRFCMWCD